MRGQGDTPGTPGMGLRPLHCAPLGDTQNCLNELAGRSFVDRSVSVDMIRAEVTMAEQAQIDELKQKMAEERGRLLAVLERLPDDQAALPTTGEGEWSAKQQMSHLCEMETAYRAWVAKALQEDGANLDNVRGERPAIPLEKAQENSVGQHLAEMRAQREKTLALIESMTSADFERTASQRMFGSLTVMQWLRSYYRHDRMHYDQVRGVEPEYKPRFTGGKEPDQRRA